jgi:hypothetical protein
MSRSGGQLRGEPTVPSGESSVADESVAAPPGVVMSGPGVLLATKLHVPRL